MPCTFKQSVLTVLILSSTVCGCLGTKSGRNSSCVAPTHEQISYREPARLNSHHHDNSEPEGYADPEAVVEVLPTLHESNWHFPNVKASTISAVESAERKIKNVFE